MKQAVLQALETIKKGIEYQIVSAKLRLIELHKMLQDVQTQIDNINKNG